MSKNENVEQFGPFGIDPIAQKKLKDLVEQVRQLKKQMGLPPDEADKQQDEILYELKRIRYGNEMAVLSDNNQIYQIARNSGLGYEIYFFAESGWLAAGGGSWSYLYNVPQGMVDIADALGWDPSANRNIDIEWKRDGSQIFKDPNTVRREEVQVYQYSDEAWNNCEIIVTNNDSSNQQAMHVWGWCHFIDKEFYDLLKRRMTLAYPPMIFPELDQYKKRRK